MVGNVSMILIPWGPEKAHEWITLHRKFRAIAWTNFVVYLVFLTLGIVSPLYAAPSLARRGEWAAMALVGITSWLLLAVVVPMMRAEWRACRREAAECLDVAEWLTIGIMPPQWNDDLVKIKQSITRAT